MKNVRDVILDLVTKSPMLKNYIEKTAGPNWMNQLQYDQFDKPVFNFFVCNRCSSGFRNNEDGHKAMREAGKLVQEIGQVRNDGIICACGGVYQPATQATDGHEKTNAWIHGQS